MVFIKVLWMDVKRTCKDTIKVLCHHALSHLDIDAALADEIVQVVIVRIQMISLTRFIQRNDSCDVIQLALIFPSYIRGGKSTSRRRSMTFGSGLLLLTKVDQRRVLIE
jgi:hypothetical protein